MYVNVYVNVSLCIKEQTYREKKKVDQYTCAMRTTRMCVLDVLCIQWQATESKGNDCLYLSILTLYHAPSAIVLQEPRRSTQRQVGAWTTLK